MSTLPLTSWNQSYLSCVDKHNCLDNHSCRTNKVGTGVRFVRRLIKQEHFLDNSGMELKVR